jgi:hypothetical protein
MSLSASPASQMPQPDRKASEERDQQHPVAGGLPSDALAENRSAAVREFLERLCSQQYVICQWEASDPTDPHPGAYQPVARTIDSWVAQFEG